MWHENNLFNTQDYVRYLHFDYLIADISLDKNLDKNFSKSNCLKKITN